MKKLPYLLAVLVLCLLAGIWFLYDAWNNPIVEKVDKTFSGWLIFEDGSPAESHTVRIVGEYLHYRFDNDYPKFRSSGHNGDACFLIDGLEPRQFFYHEPHTPTAFFITAPRNPDLNGCTCTSGDVFGQGHRVTVIMDTASQFLVIDPDTSEKPCLLVVPAENQEQADRLLSELWDFCRENELTWLNNIWYFSE